MISRHSFPAGGRRGSILPMLALTITGLVAFLAMAIDIGLLVVAKNQVQNAADLAALTAARTLNGDSTNSYNQGTATTNAQNLLSSNNIVGSAIQSSQLTLSYGTYDYSQSAQTFSASFPGTTGMPTTAVAATVTSSNTSSAFSSALGFSLLPSVSSSATAVHRPRDIALVIDLSGSMRMGSCLGFDFYTSTRSTNNNDGNYPKFGHYSSASAGMHGGSADQTSTFDSYTISATNTTAGTTSYTSTVVNSFYSNATNASTLVRAFDSYTSGDGGVTWIAPTSGSPQLPATSNITVPGGDVPLFTSGSTTNYATDVKDVLNSSTRNASWELDGYSSYTNGSLSNAASGQANYTNAPFNGYTQGPTYYGKTFFIWPPDPRQPLTSTNNTTQITQFLTDFGYTSSDFTGATTGPPLNGIFSATTTTGSQTWPWPNDSGSTLSSYLTSKVYIPGGSRKLTTSDSQYQQIMRLYSWNSVIDNLGTTPCDWRVRFFGTNDNTKLFNGSGSLNTPGASTYTINYNEILRWLSQSPNPFPTQLRAGHVKYYGSMPTSITGSYPSYGGTDQRFWVEYINYVLGFYQTGASSYTDISAMAGYGSDFTWGTVSRTAQPSATQYMSYTDIPARPRLRLWFGPLTFVDFLQNFNMWCNTSGYFTKTAGDSYEAPLYSAKEAYLGAVSEMKNNHPNDWFTLIAYSWPRTSATATWSTGEGNSVYGRFNAVLCPLGTSYGYATSSLLYPVSTFGTDGSWNNTEVSPYDKDPNTNQIPSANFNNAPRADGETCFSMALMLAYNQFATTATTDNTLRSYVTSSTYTFPPGMAGGLGRKGAQKVVIFETDGLPNTTASATLTSGTGGAYKYYPIRYDMNKPTTSEYPACTNYGDNNSNVTTEINNLVTQLNTDYSTTRNPFKLYTLGFGPVFAGTNASSAEQTLQAMQYHGGTQSSASTALPTYQIITGSDSTMTSNMNTAFTKILQGGVQIALIK